MPTLLTAFTLHFSTDFVRHFPRYPFAALLKCFAPFRRLRRHFSTVSPSLLAGYTCSSRWLCQHFSTDLVRHFSPVSPALLKCFVSFRRLCRHFSQASPALLAGSACSSRRTSSVTSRGFIPPLFSNVYSLLAGSPGSSLQQSYFALNYYFK